MKIGVVEATYDGVNGGSQTVSIADRMDRKEWAKIRGNKLVAPDEYNPYGSQVPGDQAVLLVILVILL